MSLTPRAGRSQSDGHEPGCDLSHEGVEAFERDGEVSVVGPAEEAVAGSVADERFEELQQEPS